MVDQLPNERGNLLIRECIGCRERIADFGKECVVLPKTRLGKIRGEGTAAGVG